MMKRIKIAVFLSGIFPFLIAACGKRNEEIKTPDENFHIYLCIGQSNMEGNAAIEDEDRVGVPERFVVMATSEFSNPMRKTGEWYKADPPLVRESTGLTLMDSFGRIMVENVPENVRIGVVPVAIGGCKIEHLSKDYDPEELENEADWFRGFMAAYDNKPYQRLVECALKAQKGGVVKGILLHQGESNTGDAEWPLKVKRIYDDLIKDLDLNPDSVPLIAGELVTTEMGGVCGGMNSIIVTLPQVVNNGYIVSADSLPQRGDGLHFTAPSYRELGKRYAEKMLEIMGKRNYN